MIQFTQLKCIDMGFAEKQPKFNHYGARNGFRDMQKQRKVHWCNINHVMVPREQERGWK